MARLALRTCLTAVLLLAPGTAQGQAAHDSTLLRSGIEALRSDLKNFATLQDLHAHDHGTFAGAIPDLEIFEPSEGVTVVVLTASDASYSGVAIHGQVPGLVCAVFAGDAPRPLGVGGEDEVVCRGPEGDIAYSEGDGGSNGAR